MIKIRGKRGQSDTILHLKIISSKNWKINLTIAAYPEIGSIKLIFKPKLILLTGSQ